MPGPLISNVRSLHLSSILVVACGQSSTARPDAGEPADADADADADTDLATDSGTDTASSTGTGSDAAADLDLDGLSDLDEDTWAAEYLPFLSIAPDDECPEMGVVFRLRPHPDDASKIHVLYDALYAADCGAAGHPGDDEVFALAADPAVRGPAGILALVAIAHQGSPCNAESRCQTCGGGDACELADPDGAAIPVVYASKNKHGHYLFDGFGFGRCDGACFGADSCALAGAPAAPPLVNAGEPGAPLVSNLSTEAFATPENGFTDPSVQDYDPWGGAEFGGAGVVADDLVDPAFDVPLPDCR